MSNHDMAAAYRDGFEDGQVEILEMFYDILENSEGRTEAFESFKEYCDDLMKEIESR